MEEEIPALVIDNGSHSIKAGFAGDDAPRVLVDTVVGRYTNQIPTLDFTTKNVHYGYSTIHTKANLTLTYPIERGLVTNWDDMEKLWYEAFFNELMVDPSAHSVLLTEPPFNTKLHRERMTQIIFEAFGVPATSIVNQAKLSLYASGRTTGVIVESGEGTTYVVPILDSVIQRHAITHMDIGGRDLTDYLMKQLSKRGREYTNNNDRWEVNELKEKHCYVALNYEQEVQHLNDPQNRVVFTIPLWETQIFAGDLRVQCPEVLFQPSLIGLESAGIHKLVHAAISKCDKAVQKDLCLNVVLSGGNTMFNGIAERLRREMEELGRVNNNDLTQVNVMASPDRKYSPWIGGSIFASVPTLNNDWITKAEYEEYGSSIVHKKCS